SYIDMQAQVDQAYLDQDYWTKLSILNAIRMGKFSSDRTINQYAQEIWQIDPVTIDMTEYNQHHAGLQMKCKI
ncbi:MAG: glycogen/starch/alpha-glucan phosphorylase, partial [Microcoleaceae cyanobacterium]